MEYFFVINAVVYGLLIGSFLNVVIYRMPLGLSVVSPRSSCPKCNNLIKWYQNIPVISYLALRGKCFKCKAKISARYPVIEAICGLAAFILFPTLVTEETLILFIIRFAIFSSFLSIFIIDIEHYIIPDKLNIFLLLLLLPFSMHQFGLQHAVLGGLGGFLFPLLVTWLFYKLRGVVGLGGGDIKLFGILGTFVGLKGIFFTIFLSCFIGAVITITLIIFKKVDKTKPIPFGPYIVIVAFVQILFPNVFTQVIRFLISS
ncbi:MAG: prepilin signal peptidase PulO-like enzyme (type II secretory pathway) [Thermoproteota archaeon]|jgi:prepilin signal peptidase PulO-like enzyme (type II secretory pathway)